MNIFAFWDKGYDSAPDVVQRVIDRWKNLNPNCDFVLLEQADLDRELKFLDGIRESYKIQAQADILRVKLLKDYGGVWVDATVLPVLPLDRWVPNLTRNSDFFAFRQCGWDRLIANWFLVSQKDGPIISKWFDEIRAFADRPRKLVKDNNIFYRLRKRRNYLKTITPIFANRLNTYPYFWSHYIFESCVKNDVEFSALWQKVAVFPNLPTHALQHARFSSYMSDADFISSLGYLLCEAPVQKLDWRREWPEEVFQSVNPDRVIGSHPPFQHT